MTRLYGFVGISFILHILLVFSLVDIGFAGRQSKVYEVYEVSIVSNVPSAAVSAAPNKGTGRPVKKFVRNEGAQYKKKLGTVTKEKVVKEKPPEISSAEIESKIEDIEKAESTQWQPPVAKGSGSTPQTAGTASQEAVWVAHVKEIVYDRWKYPPGITLDASLKVTFFLRISRNGNLLEKNLILSSRNTPFDRSVMIALNSINKIPPPPIGLVAGRNELEINMTFSPPRGVE